MNQMKNENKFLAYDYKYIRESQEEVTLLVDGYQNFGWEIDNNFPFLEKSNKISIKLKRDRKIANKVELTRLQQHFEACFQEINSLEKSKRAKPLLISIGIGILGTIFMAGSTFAVTAKPPIIWLCILLAIPGFTGWILPYFLYKYNLKKKENEINELINKKQDEIYAVCEKGFNLL